MVKFNRQKLQVGGRVRIPDPILDKLEINKGDAIEIELKEDHIIVRKK